MKEIVDELRKQNKTIAAMESCTGGFITNEITNIEGASNVLRFSAVTYSNEYKIKMGVLPETISTYTVYSMEVAREMSLQISQYADADYGIGITGQLNGSKPSHEEDESYKVYISLYDREHQIYYEQQLTITNQTRREGKQMILEEVKHLLNHILLEK